METDGLLPYSQEPDHGDGIVPVLKTIKLILTDIIKFDLINYLVGFEVLTAVSMKIAVFWDIAPCSLIEVYQRFRGPCCLYHQGERL
jgi:hypothetical protein